MLYLYPLLAQVGTFVLDGVLAFLEAIAFFLGLVEFVFLKERAFTCSRRSNKTYHITIEGDQTIPAAALLP